VKKIPGNPWSEVPFPNLIMRPSLWATRASANYVFYRLLLYRQALFLEFRNKKGFKVCVFVLEAKIMLYKYKKIAAQRLRQGIK